MNPLEWEAPWFVISAALFVIVMLRANGTYWLGRLVEHGAQRTRVSRLMASPGYGRAVERLNRWGAPVVTVSFLTIGVQTLVNFAAGATRMPLRRYLPAVTIGCLIWAVIYGTVGTIGIRALGLLWQLSPALTIALALVLVSAATWFVVRQVRAARAGRVSTPDPAQLPRAQSTPATVERAPEGSGPPPGE